MAKTIISEGRTTNEAIENGLKQLKATKKMVEIKVLENEDKRSFFSILTPRVVKVQLTLKEETKPSETTTTRPRKEITYTEKELESASQKVEKFLTDIKPELPEGTTYKIDKTEKGLEVSINNQELGFLIGYRGETLYALQNILSTIASKGNQNRVRVILDIEGYKEKREKTLEELAEKVAKTVIRTKKPVKLEPMQAYERKIIHSKLQSNEKVQTISEGQEPHRRIVISLKK